MKEEKKTDIKTCFVVMPISDPENYPTGHFKRVYEYIIKPACEGAGFIPIRADDIQTTNHIVIDVLKRIISADIVICDLSSRNPNVLYELGIRQAFNLPVTLIKDLRTERIFDIQGLRDIEYDENLRIDTVNEAVLIIQNTLKNTAKLDKDEVNSIIQLLGVKPASLSSVEISKDTSILLDAIGDLGKRITRIESSIERPDLQRSSRGAGLGREVIALDKNGNRILPGLKVHNNQLGTGRVKRITPKEIQIDLDKGSEGAIFIPYSTSLEIISEDKTQNS